MPSVSSKKTNCSSRIDLLPYKKEQKQRKSFEASNDDISPAEKIKTKLTNFMIKQFNKHTEKKRKFEDDGEVTNKKYKKDSTQEDKSGKIEEKSKLIEKSFGIGLKKSMINLVSQKLEKFCPKVRELAIAFENRKMLK